MSVGNHVKGLLSQNFRNALRPEVYLAQRAVQKMRQLAGQKGRLPDFLVLGAQKAGTTTLYDLIMQHPEAAPARTKELAFFDRHYDWGLDWYKSNFPDTGKLTGEATPCYLYSQPARERIAEHLPQSTKFIVLLRNPVDRAISHYYHEKRLGYEGLSLSDALDMEARRLSESAEVLLGRRHENRSQGQSFSYMDRGNYAAQLKAYFELFPRENFYIETSDRFFAEPNDVTGEIFGFLGLPLCELKHVKPRNVGVYSGKIAPEVYNRLTAHFEPYNHELAELLERKLPWQDRLTN
jgi:hypothetical protein